MKAIREASPQARHHCTLSDQVNQLVSAREADPDLGFMARLLALCSLPCYPNSNQDYCDKCGGPTIMACPSYQTAIRKMAWPDLNYTTAPGLLILLPSTPTIAPLNQGQLDR